LLPTAVAHAIPDKLVAGGTIGFFSSGSFHPDPTNGEPLSYSWDFGDGVSSNLANPSYAYSSTGTHIAVLTITDSSGFVDTDTVMVQVVDALAVSASANPDVGLVPLIVEFYADASGGIAPLSYSWNFDDGFFGAGQNPTHPYLFQGVFTATVTVTDSAGNNESFSIPITAVGPPPP
jgi:PKD repeat protein